MKKQTPENISGKVNETNKEELEANESGELRQVNSSREFGAKEIASLADATADEVDDLADFQTCRPSGRSRAALRFPGKRQSLVMQDLDPSIAVESDLDDENILDLGLQRIEIDLSDEIRAQLEEGSQSLSGTGDQPVIPSSHLRRGDGNRSIAGGHRSKPARCGCSGPVCA